MRYVLAVLIGYLLGCSNMAHYIAKLKKVDLRAHGSGNPGASNAAIVLGWRAGILTALHDIGKAALAVFLAGVLLPHTPLAKEAAGVACVIGHIFPVFLKFKGGKGFASYLGMTLVLNWKLALLVMAAVVLITLITDYIVLGTFATVAVVPIWQGIALGSWVAAAILLAASALIVYKHRENIPRLLSGTEIGLRSTVKKEHRVDHKKEKV